ncbi:MAG TPA: hypothetical protein VEK73_05900 [Xanthobacteraceae bacterium]|nr:hypothetical protein [Xanthobacteraceae bacterium]
MKTLALGLIAAAALGAGVFATPCAATPMGNYRYPPLAVAPGLYYGCRPGWYCFGPEWNGGWYRPAWYGGFGRYGYQGRWFYGGR